MKEQIKEMFNNYKDLKFDNNIEKFYYIGRLDAIKDMIYSLAYAKVITLDEMNELLNEAREIEKSYM